MSALSCDDEPCSSLGAIAGDYGYKGGSSGTDNGMSVPDYACALCAYSSDCHGGADVEGAHCLFTESKNVCPPITSGMSA